MPEWRSAVLTSRRRERSRKVMSPTRLWTRNLERLAAVEGGRHQPAERDIRPGDLEDVPPPHQARPRLHLLEGHPGGPGGADQRADAGAHHQAGHQAPLLEGPEHTDVGEPLEAAATEHQGEGSVRVHSLAPAEVACVTYARRICKNRAPRAVWPNGASRCAVPTCLGNPDHGTDMARGALGTGLPGPSRPMGVAPWPGRGTRRRRLRAAERLPPGAAGRSLIGIDTLSGTL